MSYLDRYKRRAMSSYQDEMESATKVIINEKLAESPTSKTIYINGNPTISRIVSGDRIEDVMAILPPDTVFDIGDEVKIEDRYWLVFNERQTTITPKMLLKQCNHEINWSVGSVEYKQNAIVKNFFTMNIDELEAKTLVDLDTPKGGMFVWMRYTNDSKTIKIGQTLKIQSQTYRVSGIDDITQIRKSSRSSDLTGIIKFTLNVIPDVATTPKEEEGGWGHGL